MSIKLLSGADLVSYISERQAKQVRALIQSKGIQPKLAIINANPDNIAIQKYIKFKQLRAKELGIKIELHEVEQKNVSETIKKLTHDASTHGIILQLPLAEPSQTDELIALIPAQKDADGMVENSPVEPATAQAILWLLAGHGIDLKGQNILVIGQGRLVGAPLIKMLREQKLEVRSLDKSSSQTELAEATKAADIIISATGSAGLIVPAILRDKQVIIDAGTSEDGGGLKGDISPEVYASDLDLKITPTTGGLGPLTISCLFENLLQLIDKQTS